MASIFITMPVSKLVLIKSELCIFPKKDHKTEFNIGCLFLKNCFRNCECFGQLNPKRTNSASKIPYFFKSIVKYNLMEYFGIDAQMKVVDHGFFILSIWLDSPMLS
jgi:hypothetical protein